MFKSRIKHIIFLVIVALLLIPQTRLPIQVALNRGLALFSPSKIDKSKQRVLTSYNWNLQGVNREIFNFEATKEQVVLVNFWATWCPPCIAEMPGLEALYKDYKDRMVFVFVSNEDHGVTTKFLCEKGYDFNSYVPLTQYPEVFDVSSIPRTFLIDKKGRIIMDKTGAANWNSNTVRQTIEGLLND
ncbi:TlpA disulfide reductase family protein [Tamlana sp. 2201CG12-4]|uniref:TlpA family protein disulfide reductase n=1 Tax=Tamlana sp. 2201CG12-4 TaxID=3112582 RepID=UPI002DB62F3C|nr:TlpA disulfide reductase family protein [Tamlana sp. 2201CG12-4]MEC3907620.1 TlpA disulfide reductase family protein [Tamlana sp. 2201CG12-4]